MKQNPLTFKRILLGTVVVLLLFAAQFLLTHSVLILEPGSPTEKVINLGVGDDFRDFTLTNSSKLLVLSRGDYTIEVAENDRLTVYRKSLGAFWVHTLDLELTDQQQAMSLGASSYGCALDQNSGRVVYYPCQSSTNNTLLATVDGISTSDAYPLLPITDTDSGNTHDELSLKELNQVSVRQYGEGFITARAKDGLSLEIRNSQGARKLIDLKSFAGRVDDSVFSVAPGNKGGAYAALDKNDWSLYVFKNLSDKNPHKVNLSSEISESESFETKILASEKYVYVLNTKGLEVIEGDQSRNITALEEVSQKIIVVDSGTGEIIAKHELPRDQIIREVSVGPNGTLIYVPLYVQEGEVFLVSGHQKPRVVKTINNTLGSICWKDDDSFYLSGDSSTSIYNYSISREASFLVYNNPDAEISKIWCDGTGSAYFSLLSDDLSSDKQAHFRLNNRRLAGSRAETLYPYYFAVDGKIGKITSFKNTINVESLRGSSPPKAGAQQKITEFLESNNVETDSLRFNFLY